MNVVDSAHFKHIDSLLVYFREYSILVCKSCGFAIQPSAIDKHLLGHRIYREDRRSLLDRIRRLPLLPPHDVEYPDKHASPFPHLPVATGYRCRLDSCGHLCTSTKRMSQHLRTQHGPVSLYTVDNSSSTVRLQTFFRGNQIRYYQVSDNAGPAPVQHEETLRYEDLLLNQGQDHPVLGRVALDKSAMQDLLYLHHYITVAGLAMARGSEPATFWTHDLPTYAREHLFLLHGMLGVAAYHQALGTTDPEARHIHKEACLQHQSIGLEMFRTLITNPVPGVHMPLMAFARLLGTQNGVNYFLAVSPERDVDSVPPSSDLSPVVEFMTMLKGGVNLYLDLQAHLPADSPLKASAAVLQGLAEFEIPVDAIQTATVTYINETWEDFEGYGYSQTEPMWQKMIPQDCSELRIRMDLCLDVLEITDPELITARWVADRMSTKGLTINDAYHVAGEIVNSRMRPPTQALALASAPCPVLLCYPKIPTEVYDHLEMLPSLLMNHLPALDGADLKAFDQAMAALVSSYARSYAADTTWARWNGIESWTTMLSSHFRDMIARGETWALVLVAHWCVLIARQEADYWHLRGQSQRLLNTVYANMSERGQDLVHHCIDPLLALTVE